MKRVILVLMCVLMFFCITISASAEDGLSLPHEFSDFVFSLPEEITENLPEGFFGGDGDKLYDSVSKMCELPFILSAVADSFGISVRGLLPLLSALCGVVVLSVLGNRVAEGLSSTAGRAFGICARMCIFSATVSGAVVSLEAVKEYFENLAAISAAFLPLSGALYAMGGNINTAVASASSMTAALSICEFMMTKTVLPFFCICLAFSVISACEIGADLSLASGYVKRIYMSFLAFMMFVISGAIAAQTVMASKADGASMKGIKFFAGSLIPITGGTVSANLGSFAASVELIRSTVGIGGIVILLMLLLPLLIRLIVLRGIYSAAAYFAGMLGADGEQRLLTEISSLYGYLEGVAALSTVVIFVCMALTVLCETAVGI